MPFVIYDTKRTLSFLWLQNKEINQIRRQQTYMKLPYFEAEMRGTTEKFPETVISSARNWHKFFDKSAQFFVFRKLVHCELFYFETPPT